MHVFVRFMKLHGLTQVQLARKLGISQTTVSHAITGYKRLGPHTAIAIEKRTKGEIRKGDIRPDLWADAQSPPVSVAP